MLALNTLSSALLALLSIASAALALSSDNRFQGLEAVEFQGKTLYMNTTALAKTNPSPEKRSALLRHSNICGTSSIDAAPSGPYSQVSDCWVIFVYVDSHDYSFWIQNNGGYAKLIGYKTCTFKAATVNWFQTRIGSGDVADLIRDSIQKWEWDGIVGTRGSMPCPNEIGGISETFWAMVT